MHLFILFIPHDDENTYHLFVCRCPVQRALPHLPCLYGPRSLPVSTSRRRPATGASRSLRALIRHDPELLSQLRVQGYRPRVHYLPPSAVQVLLEHLGTPEEFYEILRKA